MANPYSSITTRANGQVIQATWFNTIRDTLVNNGAVKHNISGTTAPTISNDDSENYEAGSTWTDTTNDKFYVCVDASTGAAIWYEVVSTTGTQTLTNKTLTAPTINNPVINTYSITGELVQRTTSQTLTNKTLTSPNINGANLNMGTASDTNRILLPSDTTTNLDLLTDVAGLIAYDTTLQAVVYNTGAGWTAVGTGSGGGGINYIDNPDAESGLTGWSTFDDGGSYVDGTGGTASNLTFTQNSTTPLRGTYDFDLVVAAADASGEGVSYDFTIDKADKFSMLSISFDYLTDAPDDFFEVRIYDVTNSKIIYPSPQVIDANANEAKYYADWQSSDSESYRLSFFVNSTDATGYTLNFDNVEAGPQKKIIGTPVTDWIQFDMTIGATVSAPTKATSPTHDEAYYRRVGDTMEIYYFYEHTSNIGAAAGSGTYTFSLPAGFSIDTSKIANASGGGYERLGSASFGTTTEGINDGYVTTFGNAVLLIAGNQTNAISGVTNTYGDLADTAVRYAFRYSVPIQGWGSNVNMSNIESGREVSLFVTSSNTSLTSGVDTNVIFNGVSRDTHSIYNNSTGNIIIPESGEYDFKSHFRFASDTWATSNTIRSGVKVNGSIIAYLDDKSGLVAGTHQPHLSGAVTLKLAKGDSVFITAFQNTGGTSTFTNSASREYLSVNKRSSGKNLLASEVVALRYTTTAGAGFSSGGYGTLSYPTKSDYDTHNAYDGTTFTSPISKTYRVSALATYTTTANWNAGESYRISFRKNGTQIYEYIGEVQSSDAGAIIVPVKGYTEVYLAKGDTLDVQLRQDSGSTLFLATAAVRNVLTISSIG